MKLETYRWEKKPKPAAQMGRPVLPHCEHENCFTCPYDDCIATDQDIAQQERKEREGRDGA